MSPDEIKIPPEPPGRCSNHLQVRTRSAAEARADWAGVWLGLTLSGFWKRNSPSGKEPAVLVTSLRPLLGAGALAPAASAASAGPLPAPGHCQQSKQHAFSGHP